MHNLALELKAQGHTVSGSDDEIYDPAKSRLLAAGLLPDKMGWEIGRIDKSIDLIILGMHAHADNPELLKAQSLGLKIQSFPEFAGDVYDDKKKIVVSGSHGKSTITAMIMHVLNQVGRKADYLLGGMLEGFDRMVSLGDSDVVVIEGDEYLSSRIDPTPKMMHYNGDVVILTGIEWDHKNVFPTFDNYKQQFANLIARTQVLGGDIIWYKYDEHLIDLMKDYPENKTYPYECFKTQDGQLVHQDQSYDLKVFGQHNLANMSAAMLACRSIGIQEDDFCSAISSFKGVGKRLERIADDPIVYLDYAHAPSKVKATVNAVATHHEGQRILGVYELHTYSSLSKDFLPHYQGSMAGLTDAIVCYDPHALEMKRLPVLDKGDVSEAFDNEGLMVIDSPTSLRVYLEENVKNYDVVLMMSSGTYGGLDIQELLNKT